MKRTIEEVQKAFSDQLKLLNRSCESYDKGASEEAVRIATSLKVFCHDHGQNISLLKQLGIKDEMKFVSSWEGLDFTSIPGAFSPLVILDTAGFYRPAFDMPILGKPRLLAFGEWWDEPVVSNGALQEKLNEHGIPVRNVETLSRKKLLATLRDKEGGSHYDDNLSGQMKKLFAGQSNPWRFGNDKNLISGIEAAITRQIAHEFFISGEIWNRGG